jgi:hypothetical protein
LQINEKNIGRPARIKSISTSSELSDSSIVLDGRHRSSSRQQRTLSSSSVTNLLTNLQNIQVPSSPVQAQMNDQQEEEEGENNLQLLINLARDTELTRIDKLHRLHSFIEDSIGMVECLSLLRFIKTSSLAQVNIHEPPLNLYLSILPTLIAFILLENDI